MIKFFDLKGLMATNIPVKLVKISKESSSSCPTIHGWTIEFKCGCIRIEDDPNSGHPKTATISQIIEQIYLCDPSVISAE